MRDGTTQAAAMALAAADGRFDRLSFPYSDRRSAKRVSATENGSSELKYSALPAHPGERLADRVDELCRFARFSYEELDVERMSKAQNEANVLVHNNAFSETLLPDVCIDRHGEISFTHRSKSGYVDIGVRGDGELSYHVR